MAGTQGLKAIEREMCNGLLVNHHAVRVEAGRLLGIDFDLVAYSHAEERLIFAEMTTSGFLGKGKSNFHVGACKKICESFAKFSILKANEDNVKMQVARRIATNRDVRFSKIQCYFVVPVGCRFIESLGWRKQLSGPIMQIEQITLTEPSQEEMTRILLNSRQEQTNPGKAGSETAGHC